MHTELNLFLCHICCKLKLGEISMQYGSLNKPMSGNPVALIFIESDVDSMTRFHLVVLRFWHRIHVFPFCGNRMVGEIPPLSH